MTPKGGASEEAQETQRPLIYLSFGAGVQSTALLVMSALGDHSVPRADVAIFADTGDEPAWVYEQVEAMRAWSHIPVVIVSVGHLSADVIARQRGERQSAPAIPAYTSREDGSMTMLQRHCTRDYKVRPIIRHVRKMVGKRRVARAVGLIGISLDEASRMKDAPEQWITNRWPLIDARLTRADCLAYLSSKGFAAPLKSACRFCPYHDDNYWRAMKEKAPVEFEAAAVVDDGIRNMTRSGIPRPVFLHRSLRPLREAVFKDDTPPLFADLECEGMCGV